MADALYAAIVEKTVPVSLTATAEAVKLTENVFRADDIALVNELKTVYQAMGIDIWEMIDAAKTKPFGFMPFYPGPRARRALHPDRSILSDVEGPRIRHHHGFIELAGQINSGMPYFVVNRLAELLDTILRKGLSSSRILLIGLAYKKNIEDMRESPSLKLIELLKQRGARVAFHDPISPPCLRPGTTRTSPAAACR